MKKINTILAAVSALLMLTVTAANSVEFKAGISANGMAAYANAKETLKGTAGSSTQGTGRTTSEEAVLATSFASNIPFIPATPPFFKPEVIAVFTP